MIMNTVFFKEKRRKKTSVNYLKFCEAGLEIRKGFIFFTVTWVTVTLGIFVISMFMLLEIYSEQFRINTKVREIKAEHVATGKVIESVLEIAEQMEISVITDKTLVNISKDKKVEIEDETGKININTMSYVLPYVIEQVFGYKRNALKNTLVVSILGEAQGYEKGITRDLTEYYYRPNLIINYEINPGSTINYDKKIYHHDCKKKVTNVSSWNCVLKQKGKCKKWGKPYQSGKWLYKNCKNWGGPYNKKRCKRQRARIFWKCHSEEKGKCFRWGNEYGTFPKKYKDCINWVPDYYDIIPKTKEFESYSGIKLSQLEIKKWKKIEHLEEITNMIKIAENEQKELNRYFTTLPTTGINVNTCSVTLLRGVIKWQSSASLGVLSRVLPDPLKPRFRKNGAFSNPSDANEVISNRKKRPYNEEDLTQKLAFFPVKNEVPIDKQDWGVWGPTTELWDNFYMTHSISSFGQWYFLPIFDLPFAPNVNYNIEGPGPYTASSEYFRITAKEKITNTEIKITYLVKIVPSKNFKVLAYKIGDGP